MNRPKPPAAATDQTDDAFVPQIIGRLASARYQASAWGPFLRTAWARSRHNMAVRPQRRASTRRWLGFSFGIFFVVALLGLESGVAGAPLGLAFAGLWWAAASFWSWLHQGLIRTEAGVPYDGFLWSNGMSYLRFSLCPLVAWPAMPIATMPESGTTLRAWMLLLLWGLAVTDLLDGWLARRRNEASRYGRFLDPMADVSFLGWVAVGVYSIGAVSAPLFWLAMLRFPVSLVGGIVLFFIIGRVDIRSTRFGKYTVFATSFLFWLAAMVALAMPTWLDHPAVYWLDAALSVLIAANSAYLIVLARAETRRGTPATPP